MGQDGLDFQENMTKLNTEDVIKARACQGENLTETTRDAEQCFYKEMDCSSFGIENTTYRWPEGAGLCTPATPPFCRLEVGGGESWHTVISADICYSDVRDFDQEEMRCEDSEGGDSEGTSGKKGHLTKE